MSDITAVTVTTSGAVLGAVLLKLRTLRGMKQGDLAETVGVGASTWSRIEKGETSLSIDQLRLAAKALGKTPGQILEMAEDAEQEVLKRGVKVEPLGTSSRTLATLSSAAIASSSIFGVASVIPVFGATLGALIGGAVAAHLKEKKDDKKDK